MAIWDKNIVDRNKELLSQPVQNPFYEIETYNSNVILFYFDSPIFFSPQMISLSLTTTSINEKNDFGLRYNTLCGKEFPTMQYL